MGHEVLMRRCYGSGSLDPQSLTAANPEEAESPGRGVRTGETAPCCRAAEVVPLSAFEE